MTKLFERFQSVGQDRPDHPAILIDDVKVDFAMLGQLADELVTTLSDSGVGAGHAVIITAPNSVETAATVLAIWALKAVPVFMSPNAPHTV